MKISLSKYVQEGCELPKFYGIAYWEYWRNYAVAYPVPINLVVRFGRWAWHELIKFRPTELDKMLRKAYDTGSSEGRLTMRALDGGCTHAYTHGDQPDDYNFCPWCGGKHRRRQ